MRTRCSRRPTAGYWIGTERGLLEFDGRRFRRYQTSHGVPEQRIRALAEDRDGNLWMASLSGVTKLRPDGFLTYGEHDGLTAARINALYEDANGQVFAVGGRWTVSRFDGTRFVSVQPRVPPGMPTWAAQAAFLDRRNAWWIVGQTSLSRYPVADRIEEMSGRPARLVYPDRHGSAACGSCASSRTCAATSGGAHTVRTGSSADGIARAGVRAVSGGPRARAR